LEGQRLCSGVMFKELFLETGDLEGETRAFASL